jgi:hypothetical protein
MFYSGVSTCEPKWSRWRRRVTSTAVAIMAFYVIASYNPSIQGTPDPADHELPMTSSGTMPKLPSETSYEVARMADYLVSPSCKPTEHCLPQVEERHSVTDDLSSKKNQPEPFILGCAIFGTSVLWETRTRVIEQRLQVMIFCFWISAGFLLSGFTHDQIAVDMEGSLRRTIPVALLCAQWTGVLLETLLYHGDACHANKRARIDQTTETG